MAAFFTREEKNLARRLPDAELRRRYESSEAQLSRAAQSGSVKRVKQVMRSHHKWEYAMLYKKILKNRKEKPK